MRTAARFALITAGVGLWFFLAHAAVAVFAWAVGI